MPSTSDNNLRLATVAAAGTDGVRIQLDGQDSAGAKYYTRLLNGQTLTSGDRVLVAKLSGTYVIMGKVGKS